MQFAAIAHLPAGLGVERRAVEHHHRGIAGLDAGDLRAFFIQRKHAPAEVERIVALKFGRLALEFYRLTHLEFIRGARPLALHLHRMLEAGEVHIETALARHVGGQVERETESIVQAEHRFAVENAIAAAAAHRAVEHAHAMLQGLGEFLLFLLEHTRNALFGHGQFGIGIAHNLRQIFHQQMKERLLLFQLIPVTQGAPDDAAQHIAAPFVAGDHAVHNQE